MKGWKTWAAAALVATSSVLNYFGQSEIAEAVFIFGNAMGLVGLGHKLEKK